MSVNPLSVNWVREPDAFVWFNTQRFLFKIISHSCLWSKKFMACCAFSGDDLERNDAGSNCRGCVMNHKDHAPPPPQTHRQSRGTVDHRCTVKLAYRSSILTYLSWKMTSSFSFIQNVSGHGNFLIKAFSVVNTYTCYCRTTEHL